MEAPPQIGSWLWSKPLQRAVQVQRVSTLWGVVTIDAVDQDGRSHHFSPDELVAVESVAPETTDRQAVVRIAAGARLAHHLSLPDTLTAPFRAGLQPLPHQIKHLEDALARRTTRLLLADEVGLGKTITAGLILTELKQRGLADRILVMTPAGLVPQWIQEMRQHFNLHLTPLYTDLLSTPETPKVWAQHDHVITSYDAVKPVEKRRGWSAEQLRAYNHARFEALIETPWDVVVVDEAHRIAGATPGVARHALAAGVASVAPHLLLLTGTPHQGKGDHFHRLVQLLDADTFATPETITPTNLRPHLLRTDKRHAVTLEGKELFVKRRTELVPLAETRRTALQKRLYSETIEYIRTGYAAAEKDDRRGIGFLMILVQRLLSSSTVALQTTLRTRLDFLDGAPGDVKIADDEEFDDPDSDLHEETIRTEAFAPRLEVKLLNQLLNLCADCIREGPDAKASFLLELLRRIQQDEADPTAKFLIFTEFTGTQRMLVDFLTRHGYKVAALNGSMDVEERAEAQQRFRDDAQVLVSTEAGGEGLNLQFAHNVVNYDLPWNPMRIEQRIGRVHRIGQKHAVSAYNLVLEGTIEHRVVEVLTSKLERILSHLGIDKLSDVLDTPSLDSDVQRVYRAAVTQKETNLEKGIDALVTEVRERAKAAVSERTLASSTLDLEFIRQRISEPVPFWLDQFATNSRPALPTDLRDKQTRHAIERIEHWLPRQPIPVVNVLSLPAATTGLWSLWRVGVRDGAGAVTARYQPLFQQDGDARTGAAANRIWDAVIAGEFNVAAPLPPDESESYLDRATQASLEVCRQTYDKLSRDHAQRCEEDAQRHADSVKSRKVAIEAIGLPEVRNHRLARLREEDRAWDAAFQQRKKQHPILEPVLLLSVRGGGP